MWNVEWFRRTGRVPKMNEHTFQLLSVEDRTTRRVLIRHSYDISLCMSSSASFSFSFPFFPNLIWYNDPLALSDFVIIVIFCFGISERRKSDCWWQKKHERLHLTTMRRKFIRHFKCSNCVTCWFFTDLQLIASYNRSENSLRSINSLLLNKFEVLACQWCFLAQHSKYLTT